MSTAAAITVIIPSLNPDEKLAHTVDALLQVGFTDIILINDGSRPECVPFFPSDRPGCTLLTHEVNRGKGAAMKTAFQYVLSRTQPTAGVVTVDGDGQHRAEDALQCGLVMAERHAVTLGVRNFDLPQVPRRSRMGNKITSTVFRVLCGIQVSDTQTGLRAIPYDQLPAMLTIPGDRYEYETNMLLQLHQMQVAVTEVPIETVYIEENQTSHFRPIRDSIRIYGLILRFISSSLLSSVVDLGVFFLLSLFLPGIFGLAADAISTLIARVVSSALNFTINRQKVFPSGAPLGRALLRYYLLAAGILALSTLSITALSSLFSLVTAEYAFLKTVLKFLIDTLLFLISFRVQREWVFANTH